VQSANFNPGVRQHTGIFVRARRRVILYPVLCALCLFAAPAFAEESPAQSFQAFMRAVLDTQKPEAERRAIIERYFDFDALVAEREAVEGIGWDEERRNQLRAEWMALFLSGEFQQGREIRILREPEPQGDRAELIISLDEPDARHRVPFLVKLTRAEGYWRWYSIRPTRDEPPPPATPEERLQTVLAELAELKAANERIAERVAELEAERHRLEGELAERRADEAPFSSPLTTALTVGRAVLAADIEALLRSHVPARRELDHEALQSRLRVESEALASWEPLDSRLRGEGEAVVRVKLQRWTDTGVKTRTLTLNMRKLGDEWLVDQEP
jgi:hypothetical protein